MDSSLNALDSMFKEKGATFQQNKSGDGHGFGRDAINVALQDPSKKAHSKIQMPHSLSIRSNGKMVIFTSSLTSINVNAMLMATIINNRSSSQSRIIELSCS